MAVETYSLKLHGDDPIGKHFRVKEFACHDGSDTILIATATVELLDQIRNHYGLPVVILSGYRTPAWNRRVGGAKDSQHVKGTAADFIVRKPDGGIVSPLEVYKAIDTGKIIGTHRGGLGKYIGFTHIDTRIGKARWNG